MVVMGRISPKSTFQCYYVGVGSERSTRGREEDEDGEILSDRVESGDLAGRHGDEGARFYGEMFVAQVECGRVLVRYSRFRLRMRLLRVDSACGELIESRTYSGTRRNSCRDRPNLCVR